MTERAKAFAAVDLGAESGRVVVGRLRDERLELDETHRFENRPIGLPDGLHWNPMMLFEETLAGLARAVGGGEDLQGVGIDTWGVDYALLDGAHRLLGIPYHYRDRRTEGMIELAATLVSPAEMYARTGIQTMPINTVFQLLAERGGPTLQAAKHLALIPDLLGLWLTGSLANELTIASTTGLLDARTGSWATDLIGSLGLPVSLFSAGLVEPGTELGLVRSEIPEIGGLPVWNVASHDTASAFVAAPAQGPGAAFLSSGTWSLLGLELDAPILEPAAAEFNLTNERGIDGTTRLLRNVMGLWLVQECRRHWRQAGIALDYAELEQLAHRQGEADALFDPDHPDLLRHGDMPSRIARLCDRGGQPVPRNPAGFVRSILVSLACKYNLVLARLQAVAGREIDAIHVVGGGARNRALCQLTADFTGLPVFAGPPEATAIGNILVQAQAAGEVGSLSEMRTLVAASFGVSRYEPNADGSAAVTYERFLALTGLGAAANEPTPA